MRREITEYEVKKFSVFQIGSGNNLPLPQYLQILSNWNYVTSKIWKPSQVFLSQQLLLGSCPDLNNIRACISLYKKKRYDSIKTFPEKLNYNIYVTICYFCYLLNDLIKIQRNPKFYFPQHCSSLFTIWFVSYLIWKISLAVLNSNYDLWMVK